MIFSRFDLVSGRRASPSGFKNLKVAYLCSPYRFTPGNRIACPISLLRISSYNLEPIASARFLMSF